MELAEMLGSIRRAVHALTLRVGDLTTRIETLENAR
jgi:hypothetical protein